MKNNRLCHALVLASCVSGLGCQSEVTKSSQPNAEAVGAYTSICSIRSNRSAFIGKTIRLRIIYKTDNVFYTHLIDNSCTERNMITIANVEIYSKGEKSVVSFIRAGDALCAKMRANVCPMTAELDVEAMVVEDAEGILAVNLQHVFSYKYR